MSTEDAVGTEDAVDTENAVGTENVAPPVGTLISAATIVTEGWMLSPGWLAYADGVVTATGLGTPPRPVDRDLGEALVVPGFVDLHVHGGGGGSYPTGDLDQARAAVALHRAHGTTTTMASLVTAGPADLRRAVAGLAGLVEEGLLAGLHLEGPWLSERRRGAHDAALLRDPDRAEVAALLDAGRGTVRMVTFAPERRGALDAIRQVVAAGVVAAVGHTDATYEVTRQAVDAGATVATHLFNAMGPVRQREPGPVVALLEGPQVTVELVMDGTHLHPAVYRHVVRSVIAERVVLVTDAMAAAGMPDGDYRLGSLDVTVADGAARLAGTDTIAGSTATMDQVFRQAVLADGHDRNAAIRSAVRQTSANPARVLGLRDRSLGVGHRADLVVLDPGLQVQDVLLGGRWLERP